MEANVIPATTPLPPTGQALAGGVIRHGYGPSYANSPITNYRKFWYSNGAAFWSAFRVYPGDGSVVNQLGSNPVTRPETAFQEVGFGYTFIPEATTYYWFDVAFQAGPITSVGAKKTSIELELLGSGRDPVVRLLNGPLSATLTLDANLDCNVQYTLLFKTKVEIAMAPGEAGKYGEVIARFPSLLVSYVLPWGMGAAPVQAAQAESPDLGQTLKALQADGNGGDVLFQPVSYKDIAQAGAAGFGGFSDAK